MREREVEKYLVDSMRDIGGHCFKFESPGRAGVADRICIFPSEKQGCARVVFVELKAPGKRPRALQMVFAKMINDVGGEYEYLSTRTEVDDFIRGYTII